MTAELQSFIADILHGRGLVDRDGFALRSAKALGKLKTWDEGRIKTTLTRIGTDLYIRHRSWPRTKVVDLLTSRIARRWQIGPEAEMDMATPSARIKILFIASQPVHTVMYDPMSGAPLVHKPLGLDHEYREIQSKLGSSKHREMFQLTSRWAARPDDLLQAFNEERPHIVHFSGHGTNADELLFLDDCGKAKPVSKTAIDSLFKSMRDNIRVVFLNACFSKGQAVAITKHIDCAIGMRKPISDSAAITFAASFYRALGFAHSVRDAFNQGIVALKLAGIPEDSTPELMSRKGIDPSAITIISSAIERAPA